MRRAALRKRMFVTYTLSNLLHQTACSMRPVDAHTMRRVNWLILAIIVVGSLRFNLKLLLRRVDFVIRLADHIHVLYEGVWRDILETALRVPPKGQIVWKEGKGKGHSLLGGGLPSPTVGGG